MCYARLNSARGYTASLYVGELGDADQFRKGENDVRRRIAAKFCIRGFAISDENDCDCAPE